MLSLHRREWGEQMISHVSVSDPRVIVTTNAVEMHEVIEDVRLPGRGIVVHRKVNRAFPTIYQIDTGTILVHPELEQKIRRILSDSMDKDINTMMLRGYNAR